MVIYKYIYLLLFFMSLTTPLPQTTSESWLSVKDIAINEAKNGLDVAISEYLEPFKAEESSARSSPWFRMWWPMDVNLWWIFTAWARRRAKNRLDVANNKLDKATAMKIAIYNLI